LSTAPVRLALGAPVALGRRGGGGAWGALAWTVARLPLAWLAPLGALLGWFVGSVLRVRRAHVARSMATAGLSVREAPRFFRSLGRTVLEVLWMSGADHDLDTLASCDEVSLSRFDAARRSGRGVVLAASHTGNWDVAACALAARAPLLVVTKRLSMRGLDAFWQRARAARGVTLAPAEGATGRARAHLARGGAVAMMIDQVPARAAHGVCCDFLGAPAWVERSPAGVAARNGVPLVVVASSREPDGRQRLVVLDVIEPPPRAGRAWVLDATRRATVALDAFVRAHPTEWLWMHRRWKRPLSS
jgi:KDO2-lipid IV(A) lauroyltransferase